jgi:hypothetical protein
MTRKKRDRPELITGRNTNNILTVIDTVPVTVTTSMIMMIFGNRDTVTRTGGEDSGFDSESIGRRSDDYARALTGESRRARAAPHQT